MAVKAPPPDASAAPNWQWVIDEDTRFYSWSGSRGFAPNVLNTSSHGSEVWTPIGIQLTGNPSPEWKVDLGAHTGWVWARQSGAGITGEVSTPTDSSLSGTFTYLAINGFQPFVSLNTNLPTGKSALIGTAAAARMDPDLVGLATFGEGFNFGPTAGVNIPLSPTSILTFAGGYTYRGSFNKDGVTNPFSLSTAANIVSLKPGDVWTINASYGTVQGALTLQGSASVSFETTTSAAGAPLYRTGTRYLLSGTAGYSWTQFVASTLNVSWSYINKNQVLLPGATALATEQFDSNSNVVIGSFDTRFVVTDALTVGPTVGFLWRDNNSYNPVTFQFVPAKTKVSAGGFAEYKLTAQASLKARVEYFHTREDTSPDKLFGAIIVSGSGVPAINNNGLTASLGGTVTF
jgi:hypothetical protein